MRTIGFIGGTTWVSTLEYYRIINQTVNRKLGGEHSARCIIYSVDFEDEIVSNQDKWDEIAYVLSCIAKKLEEAGADFIIICANTLHRVADIVEKNINIPLINIVDVTAEKIKKEGFKQVGLLGTNYTMEMDFYKDRLKEKHGIKTIIPEKTDRYFVHNVIFNELSHEIIKQSSKQEYVRIINKMVSSGAQGVILGCTEIPLLIKQEDVDIPVFDTTSIHAEAVVEYALK